MDSKGGLPIQRRVFFSGRVQGVGFRYSTHSICSELGLRGFVRNLQDGRVEAVLQGADPTVEKAVGMIRGRFSGFIDALEVQAEVVDHRLRDFRIVA